MDLFWLLLILFLYAVLAISLVVTLLLYSVKPSKTLAWLLAIFTIPVGGMLLYWLFGRNRRKNKLFTRKKEFSTDQQRPSALLKSKPWGNEKIRQLISRTTGFSATDQNRVLVLHDGKETFESIFSALEQAQSHIHIQYYIFEDGLLAEKLLALFEEKVLANVSVKLLYDGIGSYSLSQGYIKKLKALGVEVAQFLPFKFGRFLSSINYRNHRKIIVVDNRIGFTGGINISDKYLKGDPTLGKWHDTHIRLEGEAVSYLNTIFLSDWYLAVENPIDKGQFSMPRSILGNNNTKTLVHIVPSGPDDDFAVIEQVYFTLINQAKEYVYITNPYIIPNQAILQSLKTAALSGVDVRLLLSHSTDIKIVDWCVQSYFEQYLGAGIKVYQYPDGFLHSKTVIVDDRITSIGTANLDDRSLQQNYEVNVILYDATTSISLRANFLRDCSKSRKLEYHEFLKRKWKTKLLEGLARLLSPLL